jgi:hypothetical protein
MGQSPAPANQGEANACATCYGTGEIVTEGGVSVCPDCLGHGRAPRGAAMEWRLRDIERAHAGHTLGCESDIKWLVHELRRHRNALVEVLTRCQDAGDAPPLVTEIRHVANDALGFYEPEPS